MKSTLTTSKSRAYELHRDVVLCKHALTKNFLSLAERLYQIKEESLYEVLDYPSFASYLASPEVSLSTTTAYSLIDIYRTFLLELKVRESELIPIGRTKLERILPVITPENAEDWLSRAEMLSTGDLTKEVQKKQQKPIYEYKFTKQVNLAFNGETHMEILLEKKFNLKENICENCEKVWWTSETAKVCTYCESTRIAVNGIIKYQDLGKEL